MAEGRFFNIFESSPDSIAISSLNTGRYLEINRSFVRVSGFTREEVIGKTGKDINLWIDPPDRSAIEEKLRQGETVLDMEIVFRKKSGDPWVALYSAEMIDYEGEPCVLSMVKDFTDRKLAEELLEAQRDLGLALGTVTRVEEALPLCMETAIRVAGMDCGGIYLVHPATARLELAYSQGLTSDYVNSTLHPADDSAKAGIIMAGEPYYYSLNKEGSLLDSIWVREGLRSIAFIPVLHEGQVIACLTVASHSMRQVPEARRSALETISAQIGNVIARVRAQEALRESEARYAGIFHKTPAVMMLFDADDGTIVDANPAACAYYGYNQQQLKTMKISDINMTDPGEFKEVIRKVLAEEENHFYFRHRLSSGEIRDVEVYSGPIDMNGQRHIFSISHDITERKKAETALKNSEQRLADIINFLPDPTFAIDLNGRVIAWNRAMEDMVGVKAENMVGAGDHQYAVPLYGYPRPMLLDLLLNPEEVTGLDYSVIQTNPGQMIAETTTSFLHQGKETCFWAKASLLFDGEGRIAGAIESIRDVTERKRVEDELRLAARVLDSMAQGLVVTDTDGYILSVNQALCAITGYDASELAGQLFRKLSSQLPDKEELKRLIRVFMANGQYQGEHLLLCQNGKAVPVWVSLSMLRDEQGKPHQYVALLTDITEQVRLRQEWERIHENAAKMQRMASLSAMSAGVVHEITQPLNAIKVMVDSMLYWADQGCALETAEVLETLRGVSGEASRIDEIIKHMRSLAGIVRATPPVPCDLNQAVQGALDVVGRQLAAHGVMLHTSLQPGLPLVMGYHNGLEEVVINLLVNAMQALDHAAPSLKAITCTTSLQADMVVLEIADNALGIDETLAENIFEPFFSTKSSDGMGLGLSIVQAIVTRNGGQIRVSNNEQGGATFTVELPALINDERGAGGEHPAG